MLVTVSGIESVISALQFENAPPPMLITEDGIVIEVSELHTENA